jgi:hypothetical protein
MEGDSFSFRRTLLGSLAECLQALGARRAGPPELGTHGVCSALTLDVAQENKNKQTLDRSPKKIGTAAV